MNARRKNNFAGVRLIQAGFHTRLAPPYMPNSAMKCANIWRACKASPLGISIEGHVVRAATEADLEDCNRVCREVHGHDRSGELQDAIARGSATVVKHDGRITGYATIIGFFRSRRGRDKTKM